MSTELKATQSAENIQAILDGFWKSNAENVRLRAELGVLRSKVRSLESLNEQIMREKIHLTDHLTELLTRRRDQPGLLSPKPEAIEMEAVS